MSLQAKDPSHARRVPRWGFNYLKASVFEIKHIKSRMQNTIVLLDKLTEYFFSANLSFFFGNPCKQRSAINSKPLVNC